MKWITNWEVAAGNVERYFRAGERIYRVQLVGFLGTTSQLSLATVQVNMGVEHNLGPCFDAIKRVGRFQFTLSSTGDALVIVEEIHTMPTDRLPLFADGDIAGKLETNETPPPLPTASPGRASKPPREFKESEINQAYEARRSGNAFTSDQESLLDGYEAWLKENNLPVTGQFVRLPASRRPLGEKPSRPKRRPRPVRVTKKLGDPGVPSLTQLGDMGLSPKDMSSALTEATRPKRPKGTPPRPGAGWYGLDLDHMIQMVERGDGAAEAFLKGNVQHAYRVPVKSRSKEDKELLRKYEAMLRRVGKRPAGEWVKLREGISREEALKMTGGAPKDDSRAFKRMDKLVADSDMPDHLKERYANERGGAYDPSVVDRITENTVKHPHGDPDERIVDETTHYADGERAPEDEKGSSK